MLIWLYKKRFKTDSTFKNGKFSVREKITTFFSGLSKLIFGCTQPVLIACKSTQTNKNCIKTYDRSSIALIKKTKTCIKYTKVDS
jgi:hypothetical protein